MMIYMWMLLTVAWVCLLIRQWRQSRRLDRLQLEADELAAEMGLWRMGFTRTRKR